MIDVLMGLKVELDEIAEWSFTIHEGLTTCLNCFCNYTDCTEIQIFIDNGIVEPFKIELADPKCFQKVVRCVKKYYINKLYELEIRAQQKLTSAHSKRMRLEQEMKNE